MLGFTGFHPRIPDFTCRLPARLDGIVRTLPSSTRLIRLQKRLKNRLAESRIVAERDVITTERNVVLDVAVLVDVIEVEAVSRVVWVGGYSASGEDVCNVGVKMESFGQGFVGHRFRDVLAIVWKDAMIG